MAKAHTERDLADCVGAVYQAATNGGDWLDFGRQLCRLLDAQRATLRLGDSQNGARNVLMPADGSEPAYVAHFFAVDPYVARARLDFAEARTSHIGRARIGAELVPEEDFLRSEFYFDFARRHERRHMIGGMAGVADATPIGLFRGEGADPFGEREIVLLQALLPHLQHALELRKKLAHDEQSVRLTHAALDAMPAGVIIVDAGLKIRFVNEVARTYIASPHAGLRSMRSGPYASNGTYLTAISREGASLLRRLVASVSSGGLGGSMRIKPPAGPAMAVLVAPLPPGVTEGSTEGANEPLALVVVQTLDRKETPAPAVLSDLYGLSRAESEVAGALFGGASAEEVSRQRGVSLTTVRSQIRSILGKSESDNLRDFERSMATLMASIPRGRPTGG